MFLRVKDVKAKFHEYGMSVKPGAIESLNRQVGYLIGIAVSRAKEDKRRRVDSQDLIVDRVIELKNKRGVV